MKKILIVLMISILCFSLASCGIGSLNGEPATYYNPAKSCSIDLPTSGEGAWIIDEEVPGDILSITDKSDSVNIQVQCMAKTKIEHIASDLTAYEEYAKTNVFNELLASASLIETPAEVPEFITNSIAYSFSADGVKGTAVFMESKLCYYSYIITAVDDAYMSNKKTLEESILTLKELSEPYTPPAEEGEGEEATE